ncbi:MAG: sensor histidine kinase [Mycobacteriaceae bacterium]
MHDIVAHSLSVVISLADGAALTNRSHPDQATTAMEQVSAVGRQALSETRRLLGVLRDDRDPADLAPQPGIDRVDDLLAHVRDAGVPTRLIVTGRPVTLAATQQTAVYRVVQEALTNVLKHAGHVTDVRVHLGWSAAGLDVEVTDDGVGPGERSSGERSPGGQGLIGMAERVAVQCGRLTLAAVRRGGGGCMPSSQWTPHR